MKISENFDVREFVSKTIFDKYGVNSKWFVSDNIIKLSEFIYSFFNDHYKNKLKDVSKVSIQINDWHYGGKYQNRGLRTIDYINEQIAKGIKTAKLSQHVGGSTNAIDFNVIVKFNDGKSTLIDSNEVRKIILENEAEFMQAGLTTLEDGAFAPTWCHADCRYTALNKILIIKP